MHCTQGMMKSGMQCSGVYQIGQAELFYSSQALKIRVLYYFEYELVWDSNKSKDRVVEYLVLIYLQNIFFASNVGITIATRRML